MVALVTGGSRGIGKEIVEYFKKNNINVIHPTREELDLNHPDSIFEYISNLPHIDILVNNAGINNINFIQNTSYSSLLQTFNTNFFSPFLLTAYLLDRFKEHNFGRIVNVSSIWGSSSKSKRSTYATSKSALHTFTRQVVAETVGYNILTNTISPGYIETDLTFQNNTKEDIERIKNNIPLKRLGTVEEIAKLCYFLTKENTYINGQQIIIDGGFLCQ